MSVNINLKIKKDSDGWSLDGEEFRDGELVGASDVDGASMHEVLAIITMVLMDND